MNMFFKTVWMVAIVAGCHHPKQKAETKHKPKEKFQHIANSQPSELEQSVRAHILLMQRDLSYQGVNVDRLKQWAHKKVPSHMLTEYCVTHGLYAWHLYLQSGNKGWKEISIRMLSQAKHEGVKDPFTICPEAWTVDSKTLWHSLKS